MCQIKAFINQAIDQSLLKQAQKAEAIANQNQRLIAKARVIYHASLYGRRIDWKSMTIERIQ